MKKLIALCVGMSFILGCAAPQGTSKTFWTPTPNVEVSEPSFDIQNDGDSACTVLWDFKVINHKEDTSFSVQPILSVEHTRTTQSYLRAASLKPDGIEFYEGMTKVPNCRKEAVERVHFSDVVVDEIQ